MYDVDYGDRELARRDYAQLAAAASPCLGCVAPACARACPNGLPIPTLTRDAARRLG
jgi:predicted aldo/keto reductase-like oxidoreductase